MRLRYRIAALAVAALSVIGLSAVALAQSPSITIVSAGNPAGQPSVLNVVITDTAADVTSVTAVLTEVGGTTTYTPPALTLATGTAENGTWTTTIPASEITEGQYTISVTAQDADSNSLTDSDAGTQDYLDQPTLTATSNVTNVTYGDQAVTFSGTLTGIPPWGGSAAGEGGVQIYYVAPGGTPQPLATTATSTGAFSGSVTGVVAGNWYLTSDQTSMVAAAQSNEIAITQTVQPAGLTGLAVTPASLTIGDTVTLTGTVDYGGNPSAVVPNASVQVTDGDVTLPAVTTDTSGDFSTTFPAADGEDLQITAAAGIPLLAQASASFSLTVQAPLSAKQFTAALQGNGTVTGGICLLTSPPNFSTFRPAAVELQYAPATGGPWKELGLLPGPQSQEVPAACSSSQGWSYYSDLSAPLAGKLLSGYYRVQIPGNAAIEPFTSTVVHSALGATRTTGFKVSPLTASYGKKVTISGRLQRHAGRSWQAYSGQQIEILSRVRGQKTWSILDYVRTRKGGYFSVSNTAGSGKGKLIFAALFAGNAKYLWSESSQLTVTFTGGATALDLHGLGPGGYFLGTGPLLADPPTLLVPLA